MVNIPGLTSLLNVINIIGHSLGDSLPLIGRVIRLVNITKGFNAR